MPRRLPLRASLWREPLRTEGLALARPIRVEPFKACSELCRGQAPFRGDGDLAGCCTGEWTDIFTLATHYEGPRLSTELTVMNREGSGVEERLLIGGGAPVDRDDHMRPGGIPYMEP